MAAIQTTYNNNLAVAFLGMIASTRPNTLISREVEVALPFGSAAVKGTADAGVRPITNVADKFQGFAVREQSTPVLVDDTYPIKSTAMLLTLGDIWLMASLAVAVGDPVYITPAGALTNVSNSAANLLINDAQWDTSTSAAGLAVVAMK